MILYPFDKLILNLLPAFFLALLLIQIFQIWIYILGRPRIDHEPEILKMVEASKRLGLNFILTHEDGNGACDCLLFTSSERLANQIMDLWEEE